MAETCSSLILIFVFFKVKCVENIWTKEGWSDGRVEKAA
jgi:hypothetical protein